MVEYKLKRAPKFSEEEKKKLFKYFTENARLINKFARTVRIEGLNTEEVSLVSQRLHFSLLRERIASKGQTVKLVCHLFNDYYLFTTNQYFDYKRGELTSTDSEYFITVRASDFENVNKINNSKLNSALEEWFGIENLT